MASSPSFRDRAYDVFISFRGEDVRRTFLSHLINKLDHKLITAFKDYEIETSRSLSPELTQAIRNSRIAVVIFSENYCSSSWCLDELLEIMNCEKKVIPVFYDLDPTHVRKQTGKFGDVFKKTCETKTKTEKEKTQQWRQALTDVANRLGYHSRNWRNESDMIEQIANDVLEKLLENTASHDSDYFVGIEDHIAKMSELLELEDEKVIVTGIWGSSGIGKTVIARTLFNRLSRHFQGSIFIDRGFVAKSMKMYCGANPNDYNMKLDLQRNFLSEILRRKEIQIDHLGAVGEKLQHQKVLIFIDDLYDQVVLDALVGQTPRFGNGSRMVVVTNDKDILMAHGIDRIYEVGLPSTECAMKMFCRYAFNQDYPLHGLEDFSYEVVKLAGSLPLGLNILGSSLRGKKMEDCLDLLPRFRRSLNGKIEKTLVCSYEGLDSEEDKAIFRHIACIFNHMEVEYIKLLLAGSDLDVDVGLSNLVNKSLIYVRDGRVEMQRLLQEMGKNIVLKQSIDEPGKREFIWRPKDICEVLEENTGTKKVLGISLNTSMIDEELHVHKSAFKGMPGLHFLEIYSYNIWEEETKLQLPKSFENLPRKLKLLSWLRYPLRCIPSNFCPKSLVKLIMPNSELEKLWEGVASLTCLVEMDLSYSRNLKEIPDLSMAFSLKKLNLERCESLVALPFSIRNLNKLLRLNARYCYKLETLPNGINLKSLDVLDFSCCCNLKIFPEISTNVSVIYLGKTNIEEFPSNLCLENLIELEMENINGDQVPDKMQLTPFRTMLVAASLRVLYIVKIPNLVELPSSFIQNLDNLEYLYVMNCINLETLPTGISLKSLISFNLSGCSRLRTFPDISTNILYLILSETAIKEVPWWIGKFSRLRVLDMKSCNKLEYIHLNVFKLKHLEEAAFQYCEALIGADLSYYPSGVIMDIDTVPNKDSDICYPKVNLNFTSCINLERVLLPLQHSCFYRSMILPGEEVPSYFTHRATGNSSTLTKIPLPPSQLDFIFRICAAVSVSVENYEAMSISVDFQFEGRCSPPREKSKYYTTYVLNKEGKHLYVWDCHIHLKSKGDELYDHVDIELHIRDDCLKFEGWGARILDWSSTEIRLGNSNTLTQVSEANQENMENEEGEECGGDDDRDIGCDDIEDSEIESTDVRWEAIKHVQMQYGYLGLSRFKLLKRLGCGDIGTVYLAELVGTNCMFAIKVMDDESLAQRKKTHRAEAERVILEMLDHPFLPTLYAKFTSDHFSCLVMDYCPGGDLYVLRKKQVNGCFPEPAARFYVAEVLLALEYLHELGVIYRDLRPENILLREDGHIMLTDFDLSLICAEKPTLLGSTSRMSMPQLVAEPTKARSNSFVGTHEYLAPEIIKGEGHGAVVDWWTFGVLLYEILYGKTPFKGCNNKETLSNVVLHKLRFPDSPLVGFHAKDLIRSLLVKDPESRLGSEKGAAEIRRHPFFVGLNWDLIRCAIPPELPDVYDYGAKKMTSPKGNNLEFKLF